MRPAHVLLASRHLGALPGFLERAGVGGRRAVVELRAAELLPDAEAVRRPLVADLAALGIVTVVDGADADLVVVGGGDPFHLLATLRAAPPAWLRAGLPYVGVSAGALVAGPTLAPVVLTSPFAPPPDLGLGGLGLVDVLALPHRHRRGRAAAHAAARARFGGTVRMVELGDREAVAVHGGHEERVPSPPVRSRRPRPRGAPPS